MEKQKVIEAVKEIEKEFGKSPFDFFNLLLDDDCEIFDYDLENKRWSHVKKDDWHDLNMEKYILWATTDNADLIWWNGERIIAMNPRSFQFMSLNIRPLNFIKEIPRGTITGIFPHDLWEKNA